MERLIIWTALPNGFGTAADGATPVLRLSVRVSPRLTPTAEENDTPVSAISDFANWPALPWTFDVSFHQPGPGGAQVTPVAKLKPVNTLVPELWQKLFCGTPPVTVRERPGYKFAHPVVRSFPAARVLEFIKARYQETAVSFPTELPSWGWFTGRAGSPTHVDRKPSSFLPLYLSEPQALENKLASLLKAHGSVPADYAGACPLDSDQATSLDFYQAAKFHAPKMAPSTKENPKPVLIRPSHDFHQILTLLGDYPPLLRLLGLVFDIEVPIPAALPKGEYVVRARPGNTLAGGADAQITPATCCLFDPVAKRFTAKPAGPLVHDGHLDLAGPEFTLAQVDIDGAALKALNFADTVASTCFKTRPAYGSPDNAGLPALRSGGLSVLMSDRATGFVKKLERGGKLEDQLADADLRTKIELSAEDIARGYRVDIFDEEKNRWFSLCQRRADYGFRGGALDTQHLPAGLPEEGTVTVAGIGATTAPDDALYLHEALFHWDGWSLVVPRPGKTIQAPGTNPATNDVGHEPTDLANAIGLEARFKVAPGSLPRLRFGRRYRLRARTVDLAGNSRLFEADLDNTGASASTTYLRFEPVAPPALVSECAYRPGESAERLVVRSWDAHASTPTEETALRHLLAPRASIQIAEQHGALDGPAPDGKSSWYETLARCDAAQVPEFRLPPPTDPAVPPFKPEKPVPYLPDPLAEGITISGLPGSDAPAHLTIPFRDGETWPAAANFTLTLAEGPLGHSWDAATRVLTLSLPKAARTTIRLSTALPHGTRELGDRTLATLGIWDWIRQAAPEAWHEKLRQLVLEGRHWMITPFRELTFVHAVQRPLLPSVMKEPFPVRLVGENYYTLKGLLQLHGASTARIDVRAAWDDIVPDPLALSGYSKKSQHAEACQIQTDNPALDLAIANHRHELGDTHHRRISYWLTATSRFREYFENVADPSTLGLAFTTPATLERPADFVLDIPSSARPTAPRIEYIVPTFGWSEERNDDGTFRRRAGNSLRVYLSGDWFSSGQGELLGVVLGHGPQIKTDNGLSGAESDAIKKIVAPIPPAGLEHFITRWGIDPIWNGGLTYQTPTVHEFPGAIARATDLTLAENPDTPATEPSWGIAVAGHPVAYDRERQLWYCDISMDSGPAYFPFVRLALARYQPCSVAGCELSRVVTNDCVQTAPDRMVVLADHPTAPRRVRVTVSGLAPQRSELVVCPNRVIVRAEICLADAESAVWAPVTGSWVPLAEMQVTKGTTVWSGEIALPQTRDAQRYRLVIEEYEFLSTDPGRGFASSFGQELRSITNQPKAALWPRLVYSDAIEVNPPPSE